MSDPTEAGRYEWTGSQLVMTHCIHGLDLRLSPRCYLCNPAASDETRWQVTGSGHAHVGEWCAKCVEHGASIARPAGEAAARPLHSKQSADGCVTCSRKWSEHTAEETEEGWGATLPWREAGR